MPRGLLASAIFAFAVIAAKTESRRIEPTANTSAWVIEQQPGGHVLFDPDALTIDDATGCTVWFREEFFAPIEISYDVTIIAHGGPHDRVSDVNCFWMASDPRAPDGCPFKRTPARTGKFSDYDSLLTYYVGMGGNDNTTTRFRRYDGTAARPLRPEHDLRARKFLLEPNKTYRIRVVAHDGVAEFWRDNEKIFSFPDPSPLLRGWFGFRTVKSHLKIQHFVVGHSP